MEISPCLCFTGVEVLCLYSLYCVLVMFLFIIKKKIKKIRYVELTHW